MPSPEEEFFRPVAGIPLKSWEKGKKFIAADNKTLLIFEQEGLPVDPEQAAIGGKTLSFQDIESKIMPDGTFNAVLVFDCEGSNQKFNSGKSLDEAESQVFSDQIPMLIDESMILSARALLDGKKLWIKSPLWYDSAGNRISGKKYVEVTVSDVKPGSIAFPLKVCFVDESGKQAWAMLNFGNSGKESRSFSNIFSISNFRDKYPSVSDETWRLISNGRLAVGMTKLECKLSLGNPTEVDSGHDYTQTLDLWHYSDGSVLWFEDGLLTRFRL